MKVQSLFLTGCIGLISAGACLGDGSVTFTPEAVGPLAQPVITSIQVQGTNLVVLASVPSGFSSVTLEGCGRLRAQAWTPKAVARIQANSGRITFRLSRAAGLEMLRLRADAASFLPDSFFLGPSAFEGQPVGGATTAPGLGTPPGLDNGTVTATGTGQTLGTSPSSPQTDTRAVEESDIWSSMGIHCTSLTNIEDFKSSTSAIPMLRSLPALCRSRLRVSKCICSMITM